MTSQETAIQPSIVHSQQDLSLDEAQMLKECERIIDDCGKKIEAGTNFAYLRGKALLTIRDRRLYRKSYKTFERYCDERFKITRQHAYRLIDFYNTCTVLEGAEVAPMVERHTRLLRRL